MECSKYLRSIPKLVFSECLSFGKRLYPWTQPTIFSRLDQGRNKLARCIEYSWLEDWLLFVCGNH